MLDHFDVTIPAGRIVAVVGTTGSGKSTFMAMLDRLVLPDEGTISLGGVELNALADAQLGVRSRWSSRSRSCSPDRCSTTSTSVPASITTR